MSKLIPKYLSGQSLSTTRMTSITPGRTSTNLWDQFKNFAGNYWKYAGRGAAAWGLQNGLNGEVQGTKFDKNMLRYKYDTATTPEEKNKWQNEYVKKYGDDFDSPERTARRRKIDAKIWVDEQLREQNRAALLRKKDEENAAKYRGNLSSKSSSQSVSSSTPSAKTSTSVQSRRTSSRPTNGGNSSGVTGSSPRYYTSQFQSLVPDQFKTRDDVIRILQEMQNAGIDLGRYGVDGKWGRDTQRAWEQYQAQRALQDAVAHPETNLASNLQQQTSTFYNPQFDYTKARTNDFRGSGIRDYAGLVNFVKANPNTAFAQDLLARFGDLSNWNQADVEGQLGVKGRYGRGIFGGGDLSDMLRSMASWAGTKRAEYDRGTNYHWADDGHGGFTQVAGSSPNGYGVGRLTGNTYYQNQQVDGTSLNTTPTTGFGQHIINLMNNDPILQNALVTFKVTPKSVPTTSTVGTIDNELSPVDQNKLAKSKLTKNGYEFSIGNKDDTRSILTSDGHFLTLNKDRTKTPFANQDFKGWTWDNESLDFTTKAKKGMKLIDKNIIERFKKGGKKKRQTASKSILATPSPSLWIMLTGTHPDGTPATPEEILLAKMNYAEGSVENDRLAGYHYELDENGQYIVVPNASRFGDSVTNPYTEDQFQTGIVYNYQDHPDYTDQTVMWDPNLSVLPLAVVPTNDPNAAIALVQLTIPVNNRNNDISRLIRIYKGKKQ